MAELHESKQFTTSKTGDVIADYTDESKCSFLNVDGQGRPLRSPVSKKTIEGARKYRLNRLRNEILKHDCAAILLYNPVNIRYAFDYTNMQIWTSREAVRYALIFAQGPAIMFEFKGCHHLAQNGSGVDQLYDSIAYIYMAVGVNGPANAARWGKQITDMMNQYAQGNCRLAVDKVDPLGLKALEENGLTYVEGQEITEQARSIKNADELELMKWTIRVAESGMARM